MNNSVVNLTERNKDKYYQDYYGNNPTWVYSPNTSDSNDGTILDKVWVDEYDTSELLLP